MVELPGLQQFFNVEGLKLIDWVIITLGSSLVLWVREMWHILTEAAYENPKFVEDILRDTVLALRSLSGIAWFSIECENYESIHNHNAFAAHEETVV